MYMMKYSSTSVLQLFEAAQLDQSCSDPDGRQKVFVGLSQQILHSKSEIAAAAVGCLRSN